jgi:hypothetical protein
MPSDPATLSASAARMVVAVASGDSPETAEYAKQQVALLVSGGDPDRRRLAELQLDQARDQLQGAAGLKRMRARAALEVDWRARLAERLPEQDGELRLLVGQLHRRLRAGMIRAARKARKHRRKQWRDALHPLPSFIDWYKVNAFAGILLAAGFVILKGFVIARGDLATALGILQYAGLATVVTAGLLSSLPILTAAMLAYTASQMIWSVAGRVAGTVRLREPEPPDLTWPLAWVLLAAFVLAAVFTPWTYLAAAAVVGLLIAVTRVVPVLKVPVYGLAALGTLIAVIVNLYTVWVPHEMVTFRHGTALPGGRTNEVGYVLSEDNGWITMLSTGQGEEHRIIRVRDATVKQQTVCERRPSPGHSWSYITDARTLWRVVTANTSLSASANPTCPYQGM